MSRKRHIKNVRERKNHWHVFFKSRKRSPQEVIFSFPKDLFSAREIQRKRDELYTAYHEGWDPWTRRLPRQQPATITVLDAVEGYCRHKGELGQKGLQGGWSQRTFKNYQTNLRAFARFAGERREIQTLTSKELDAWLYQGHLSEETSRMYRRQLKTFLTWLRTHEYAALDLPVAPVKIQTIPEFVTLDELEEIIEAHRQVCRDKASKRHYSGHNSRLWMEDVFRFAFFQPHRQGEIAGLTPARVNLRTRQLRIGDRHFRTKGRREHFVRITDEAFPILERYYQAATQTGRERIFRNRDGRMFGDAFREAARAALPARGNLHFHSLRHGGAIYRLKNGWGIYDVSRLLTHASVKTTENYLLALDNEERRRFRL